MAKREQKSNREMRKPKKDKSKEVPTAASSYKEQFRQRERIARSLRRLNHRLEQRGRGYVIDNTGGTIVHERAVLSLDEVEACSQSPLRGDGPEPYDKRGFGPLPEGSR